MNRRARRSRRSGTGAKGRKIIEWQKNGRQTTRNSGREKQILNTNLRESSLIEDNEDDCHDRSTLLTAGKAQYDTKDAVRRGQLGNEADCQKRHEKPQKVGSLQWTRRRKQRKRERWFVNARRRNLTCVRKTSSATCDRGTRIVRNSIPAWQSLISPFNFSSRTNKQ